MLRATYILVSLTLAASAAFAGEKTFRKEVRQIVGSAQSQDDARSAAIAKARRDALEEAGTWLESTTEVKNLQLVRDDVTTLSAGITSTRVVLEQPFVEGQAVGIRVVAEVRVDTSKLDGRIRAFVADRERVAEKKAESARERELLARLADLERRMVALQAGSPEQKEALRKDVQDNSRKLAAQAAYRKGDALWKGTAFSNPKAAVAAFDEAIRLDPNYAAAYLHRGRAYRDLKQYDKALADMDHALRLDPNLPYGYASRAWTYIFRGDFQRAYDDADREIRRSPKLPSAYHARGAAKRGLTNGREGTEDIRKACDLRYKPACDAVAHIEQKPAPRKEAQPDGRKQAARAAYKKGDALWKGTAFSDPKAAAAALTEAIDLDPDYAAAYLHRGRAYRDLKQYDKALADMNRALQLDPKLSYGYVSRAWTYYGMGDFQRAYEDADREVRRSPKLGSAYHARGLAKRSLTQGREGMEDVRKACDLKFAPACEEVARAGRK